jgi:hypothetical protein
MLKVFSMHEWYLEQKTVYQYNRNEAGRKIITLKMRAHPGKGRCLVTLVWTTKYEKLFTA